MNNEKIRHSAAFVLESSYPEVKDAEIIVTNFNDGVTVGVKARYYEATMLDGGCVDFTPKQVGDYRVVDKNSTVEEFFNLLKEVLTGVSNYIEEANKNR